MGRWSSAGSSSRTRAVPPSSRGSPSRVLRRSTRSALSLSGCLGLLAIGFLNDASPPAFRLPLVRQREGDHVVAGSGADRAVAAGDLDDDLPADRKSGGSGMCVSGRVDIGGRRISKTKSISEQQNITKRTMQEKV